MPRIHRPAAALIAAAFALSGCAVDLLYDVDAPQTRLEQGESHFLFRVEPPKAKALGCTGYEMCPQMRALLDERMKAKGYCTKGYSVNSVSWTHEGQFYAMGSCQRA